MSANLPVIYLAFANVNDPAKRLDSLSEEEDKIREILRPREQSGHFDVEHDSFATIEKLNKNLSSYKENLILFHYSGHAGESQLFLEGEEAQAAGLADFLGQCPKLKLVVLNGCSTKKQVDLLLEKGVPAVIATYAPVNDASAKQFAINFYGALADTDTIMEAFKEGISGAKMVKSNIEAHRGIKLRKDAVKDGELWGLFGEDEAVNEKLPTKFVSADPDFKPNSKLIDSLFNGMSFLPAIEEMINQEESLGMEVPLVSKRNAILEALPHPISEPLRKLLVESRDTDNVHYDRKTPERVRQMVLLHDILIESIAFIALSELWDARLAKKDLTLPPDTQKEVMEFLHRSAEEHNTKDCFAVVRHIIDFLQGNEPGFYVKEIAENEAIFAEDHPFYKASAFMTSIKSKGDPKNFDAGEVEYFSVEGEKNLAQIMEKLCFLAKYSVVSVISIDVIKHRSLVKATYVHRMVELVQRVGGLGEEPKPLENYMETTSVLLIRREGTNGSTNGQSKGAKQFLNLTPFVIDKNAFSEKATLPMLYFFDHLDREKEEFRYWYILKPTDDFLDIGSKEYNVLRAQFKAFFRLFFN